MILLIPAISLLFVRFSLGIKLEIFTFKVFAIYSSYLDTKYFELIDNHFSEEIGGILLLVALLIICFTKEKVELEYIAHVRLRSLLISIYVNTILLIIAFLSVFGFGFVKILMVNIYSPFIIYIFVFKISLWKSKKIIGNTKETISITN